MRREKEQNLGAELIKNEKKKGRDLKEREMERATVQRQQENSG